MFSESAAKIKIFAKRASAFRVFQPCFDVHVCAIQAQTTAFDGGSCQLSVQKQARFHLYVYVCSITFIIS